MFCTLGYVNSRRVYQAYCETHQLHNVSRSSIARIGSLQAYFIFSGGLIDAPLFSSIWRQVILPLALFYQFMLAQGILGGLANGYTMAPSMAATPQYFNKKCGAAMGIAIAGSSIGGVILPIALNRMLNNTNLGFGWSGRVVAFIVTGILIPACIPIKARLPPRKSQFLLPSAFKDPQYSLLVTCYCTSDRLGRLNILCAPGISSGILTLCWQRVQGNSGIIMFTAIYGFCSGAIISGSSVSLASCSKDPKNIGTFMGMGIAFGRVAALIGPPISGALYDQYENLDQVSTFYGVVCLFGGILVLLTKNSGSLPYLVHFLCLLSQRSEQSKDPDFFDTT
ncbi:major facilitator superfamily domain-containing protein [Aspergillus alliaceus]|uniref:major facilitator superfamily domain-containing protein n=1 Tax=Petromyces alliaceus TaxID=209559 RepID=UPI0012A6965A|nr:major facilitator superfamily domain-containing protein [Aspergillus alliaceus]KAB8233067.1 major facilitator superfamily domain-containing protein [Aspergillus alliaceus]